MSNIIVCALVETINKNIITTTCGDPELYADQPLDLDSVKCNIKLCVGDYISMHLLPTEPPSVHEIQPYDNPKAVNGVVTNCSNDVVIIKTTQEGTNEKCLYYRSASDSSFEVNMRVSATIIGGSYRYLRGEFEYRCLDITVEQKVEKKSEKSEKSEKSVSNGAVANRQRRMQRPVLQPFKNFYNLPIELIEAFEVETENELRRKLDALMPIEEMTMENYAKLLHDGIHLEEMNVRNAFLDYRHDEAWFQWEQKKNPESQNDIFTFTFHLDNAELRPQISIGDRVCARKVNAPGYPYFGTIKSISDNVFRIKFRNGFKEDFNSEKYIIEFRYHRTVFIKRHEAVDNTMDMFKASSPDFLFPTKDPESKTPQLDVDLDQNNNLLLNGQQIPWFNDQLNIEQMEAVALALRGERRPLPFLINGPPGTGKTSVVIEITLQLHKHFPTHRILIAAQSNNAADLVAKRLLQASDSIAPDVLRMISNSVFEMNLLPKELENNSACIMNSMDEDEEAENARAHGKRKKYTIEHLKKFRIVVSTCVAIGVVSKNEIDKGYFNHIIIEEAGQCEEPETLIPISLIKPESGQIIMSGDPKQLPPMVMSFFAKDRGYDVSMFERLLSRYNSTGIAETSPGLVQKLIRNYRALPAIVDFYNKQFYDSELISTLSSGDSAEAQLLKEVRRQQILPVSSQASFGLYFIDVDNGKNKKKRGAKSWLNVEELITLRSLVPKFLEITSSDQIGIIAPYHSQVVLCKKMFDKHKDLLIGSVEQFQGEERKVILVSTVRTSGRVNQLKFLFCPKRLNTAVSRARAIVVVLGKANLLRGDPNWADYIQACQDNGTFVSKADL